jgi:hypothetical protein
MQLQFLPEVVYIPERSAMTVDLQANGRRVRVLIGNTVLSLIDGAPVVTQAGQVDAFERCPRRRNAHPPLASRGRSAGGGICLLPEDVR